MHFNNIVVMHFNQTLLCCESSINNSGNLSVFVRMISASLNVYLTLAAGYTVGKLSDIQSLTS